MSWTEIVNKGTKSWWIVQNNQPAGAGSFCNAVPDVDDWNTLSVTTNPVAPTSPQLFRPAAGGWWT